MATTRDKVRGRRLKRVTMMTELPFGVVFAFECALLRVFMLVLGCGCALSLVTLSGETFAHSMPSALPSTAVEWAPIEEQENVVHGHERSGDAPVFLPVVTDTAWDSPVGRAFAEGVLQSLARRGLLVETDHTATIARAALVRAHPEIELDTALRRVARPHPSLRMLADIQESLEGLALERALIIDCKPAGDQRVGNCGLYEYARDKSAVVTSSSKVFGVPVSRAERWAEPLCANLLVGRKAARAHELERQTQEFVNRSMLVEHDERNPGSGSFGLGLAKVSTGPIAYLPWAELALGANVQGNRLSLRIGGGQRSVRPTSSSRFTFSRWNVGVGFELRSEALETLVWKLGVDAGVSVDRIRTDGMTLREDAVILGLRPGVATEFGPGVELGVESAISWRAPLSRRIKGPSHSPAVSIADLQLTSLLTLGMNF